MTTPEHTRPSDTTRATEKEDAQVKARPDAAPTSDEEQAAERAQVDEEAVARSYEEATERGAHQEGEGRIP